MPLTLLLGGARSGKSSFAVDYASRLGGAVTYIATAPPLDEDMERRIAQHRAERPTDWFTIEEQIDLLGALESVDGDLVIIDCLTLWTSNLMFHGHSDEAIVDTAGRVADRCRSHRGQVIAISNEVGLGIHPDTPLGRRYRDVLGFVNQRWAAAASAALLMVAGRALPLQSADELLELHDLAAELP